MPESTPPAYSILTIEDDPSYRRMVETILCMEGFEVRTACDGATGLALLRERKADLILCDIMMPGLDGHTVLQALRCNAALAATPFIFVSAKVDRADVRRGMSAGADDYLLKPFSAEELLAAVNGRIRRHEMITSQREEADFPEELATLRTKITPRELEVLLLVGEGATSRNIALQLGISLKTVEVHRANMMNKLKASNAVSLARWAWIAEKMFSRL
jgi:DNA-binding NarL/FixJ family response regulator